MQLGLDAVKLEVLTGGGEGVTYRGCTSSEGQAGSISLLLQVRIVHLLLVG